MLPLTTREWCGPVTCFDLAFRGGERGAFFFSFPLWWGWGGWCWTHFHTTVGELRVHSWDLHAAQLCCTYVTTWNKYLHCVYIMVTIIVRSLLNVTQIISHGGLMLFEWSMSICNAIIQSNWMFFFVVNAQCSVISFTGCSWIKRLPFSHMHTHHKETTLTCKWHRCAYM